MEMRREIRYRLDAPAVFSWEGGPHRKFQGEGVTRDISVQSAFILTATMPPPNCAIHVDLLLPSLSGTEAVVHISGKARVIRVQDPSANTRIFGFAVVTDDLNQWGLTGIHCEFDVPALGVGWAN
jgi:hypothetical protein